MIDRSQSFATLWKRTFETPQLSIYSKRALNVEIVLQQSLNEFYCVYKPLRPSSDRASQ